MITINGKLYKEERLQEARNHVADWRIANAKKVREQDTYAPHVREDVKDAMLAKALRYAEEVRLGMHDGVLSVQQRMVYYLTGKSFPICPKSENNS